MVEFRVLLPPRFQQQLLAGNAWPGVQLGEALLIFRVKSSFSGGQLKAADLEVQM